MLLLNDSYKTVSDHFFAISIFIFNKTEVQRVSLRCLTDLNPDLLKSYDTKSKYFHFRFFCDFVENSSNGFSALLIFFAFQVIKFVPIKIQTWSAPQNDGLSLSFVKDEYKVGKKMTRNGHKMAIYQLPFFESQPRLRSTSECILDHSF